MIGGQHAAAPRRERQQKAIAFDRQDQREVVILFALGLGRRIQENSLPPPAGRSRIRRRRLVPASAVTGLRVHHFDLDFRIAETRQPFRRARIAAGAIDDEVRLEPAHGAVADLANFHARHARRVTRRGQQSGDVGPFDQFDARIFLDAIADDRLDQQAAAQQHQMSGVAALAPSFRIQDGQLERRVEVEAAAFAHRSFEPGKERAQLAPPAVEQAREDAGSAARPCDARRPRAARRARSK